ncbi:MAG TPA: tetratricopeptide repeat protein, partial [Bryobacteraceae bacterium]|nr:tetratricopeptide repeat protein [Bryobacteraceae bacterium]
TPAGQRVVADSRFPLGKTADTKDAYRRHTKGNSLYRNRGDGTFEEVPDAGGAIAGRWAWGAEGIDFDNDGVPEIVIAAGMLTNSRSEDLMGFFWRQVVARSPATASPAPEYENGWDSINQYIREDYSWNGREPNLFYVRAGGRYCDYSGVSGLDYADDTRTFAATDFDGDGNLDLFLKSRLGPQVRVLRNNCGAARKSICFALRGTKSNRDGIGAVVEVEAGGRRITKSLQAGSGYLSQHTKRVYFGLADADHATRVRVRWPSGLAQEFEHLEAGYWYDIVEGSTELKKTAFLPRQPMRSSEVIGDNSVRLQATWLLEPVPIPEKRKGPGFLLLTDGRDTAPQGVSIETLDLKKAAPDTVAAYTLFRRYLFDWRAPLTAPTLLLLDAEGRANKIYPGIPPLATLRSDLAAQDTADRIRAGLPFPGRYVARPMRNYYKLGAAFVGAGYPEQALPFLDAAVRQWPGNFKAWLALGQVHLELNRLPNARLSLEKALALNRNSPEVWNNLGGVAIAEGKNEEALRCFDTMLSIAPKSVYGLTNAALALSRLNRKADAERLYRQALEIDPKDSDTMDRLGLLIAQQGRTDEAIALFKQALTRDPQHVSAINNLGVAYAQAGRPAEAIAALSYGVRVAPDRDMIALNLARVYVAAGDRERAKDVLKSFLTRVPDNTAIRRALQQLGEP